MSTVTASGTSNATATPVAATEAIRMALAGLGDHKPRFGFLFMGTRHSVDGALATAREMVPGADFAACTTAGEITERGLSKGALCVLLIASDELIHAAASVTGVKANTAAAAYELCARFGETAQVARAKQYVDSITLVLVDGLSGVGDQLVGAIRRGTRPYQQIVGGAAGDDGQFKATQVGCGTRASTDGAVAVHVFSPTPWGVGVDHGLEPSTGKMQVTRATGNVVHELDGKPAFEVYQRYAKERGVTLTPENAGSFLINNELGVYFLSHLQRARAPLSVGADGSLACAADVPQGSIVSILDGTPEALVAAARRAAEEAKESLQGARAAGILLFDCICRGSILDREFQREIDAIKQVFPNVPIAGFLTYGEIARYKGKLDGWHNTTAVVAAIPA